MDRLLDEHPTPLLDGVLLRSAANEDAEFVYAAREWTVRIHLHVDGRSAAIRVVDGVVVTIATPPRDFDPADIVIRMDSATWTEMTRAVPRPFHQDLWGAMYHHGVTLDGDVDALCAYYGAVARLLVLMRPTTDEPDLDAEGSR